MTFQDALHHLDQGTFSPLYLITGDEPYLIDHLRHEFLKKILDPAAHSFNFNAFRAEETKPDTILSVANTFPILSPHRLVLIQNADQLKDDQALLLDYLSNPSETTILVFIAEKPDMRKKFFSTLKKKATIIACPRPRERELPLLIRQETKKLGLHLSEEALWFLKEHLGCNLLAIHQELEKIALYHAGEDQESEITMDVVQTVIGNGRSHSIFELTHAVGQRDGQAALKLLEAILSEGAHPLFVLSMLTRLWRQMAMAKMLIASGQSSTVPKKISMPPSLLQAFLKQLKKWSLEDIRKAFAISLSADSQLKGSPLKGKLILETLIFDLCLHPQTSTENGAYSTPFLSSGRL